METTHRKHTKNENKQHLDAREVSSVLCELLTDSGGVNTDRQTADAVSLVGWVSFQAVNQLLRQQLTNTNLMYSSEQRIPTHTHTDTHTH